MSIASLLVERHTNMTPADTNTEPKPFVQIYVRPSRNWYVDILIAVTSAAWMLGELVAALLIWSR